MEFIVKKVRDNELDNAFLLIWNTFLEFVAPDYSQEGIETFKAKFIEDDEFRNSFKNGKQTMYGSYLEDKLVGVLSISSNNHISCVFVDKNYHRKGIATSLFHKIILDLKNIHVIKIKLNASQYAIPFYHSLGFKDIDAQKEFQGIIYTPMELEL
jgi:GNAT superfamily N-acetyltransferase